MPSSIPNNATNRVVNFVVALAAVALAYEPAVWLLRTWVDPSWGSEGGWICAACVGLVIYSLTSPRTGPPRHHTVAWGIVLATAFVRVVGRVLAINVVGAVALVFDVFAIGLLLGLSERRRAVSPLFLSGLFALSLPIERILQRVIGFPLQQVSAAGACELLGIGTNDLQCSGVDIVLNGQHVLVDLPCSGARGLVMIAATTLALMALSRPSIGRIALTTVVAVVMALLGNTVRVALLALGIAYVETIDVMAQPWHDVVGLFTLALGLFPIVLLLSASRATQEQTVTPGPPPRRVSATSRIGIAAALIVTLVVVSIAPERPVDVAKPIESIELPRMLRGKLAEPLPLTAKEREYFTQFGGAAARSRYGNQTLLVVRTSAPLRHLHAPDECLTGSGFEVVRNGVQWGAFPGAQYTATDATGASVVVLVTYTSSDGQLAHSVGEAVSQWLRNPGTTWSAIERIHPATLSPGEVFAFEAAVANAFGIEPNSGAHP